MDGTGHELLQPVGVVADLQLQEPRAGLRLLQRPLDAVRVRRRTRVLHRPDEQVRRRVELAAGQVRPATQRGGEALDMNRREQIGQRQQAQDGTTEFERECDSAVGVQEIPQVHLPIQRGTKRSL